MKKTNKGFSMVELIIVIAIMAILAGALAPALIKYINKSRISTDIQTANTIATAIQTGLANENGYDGAMGTNGYSGTWTAYDTLSGDANGSGSKAIFASLVVETVGSKVAVKSKKCSAKTPTDYPSAKFEFLINGNEVQVRESVKKHALFPTADGCLTDGTTCNR